MPTPETKTVGPDPGHTLYTPGDFTSEEYERDNLLARLVIDGGLGVCKHCGAGEIELDNYATCADYNREINKRREVREARRGLYWIDLRDVLDGSDSERPYVFIDHAADRLIMRVDDASKVAVLTASRPLRDLLAEPGERNPSGVEVMTVDMARSRGLPQKNLILLGHTRIGNMRNRFYRMIRNHQQKFGFSVLCLDGQIPPGLKQYAVASALGKAMAIYGPYRDFVARNFHVRDVGNRMWIGEFKEGAAVRTGLEFMKIGDDRFDGSVVDLFENEKPESVNQNRLEETPI